MATYNVPHLLLSLLVFLLTFSSLFEFSYTNAISIHDFLRQNGLPGGLFPKEVKSYTISETGLLEVYLESPCLAKFDTMAYYESVVRGNLTYGGLTGVEGFSQEELFLWLPVLDIILDDPLSGIILFDIGLAHKQLSLSLFEDPPDCAPSLSGNHGFGE
ncbi:putative Serine protease [Heracleum sosnowskyi]|uniref:Serine protease n=1 Tax=Heracleum sosnowskyi TaxID=360622 RepID=A0AAD8H5C3_9APIA|nr:putative Serine protease [Heracleum sosnowskyi]